MSYKLFEVGDEFIIAQTGEEALQNHLDRVGNNWYKDDEIPEPVETPLEAGGVFEQEEGGHKGMTFGELIGVDFVYKEPTVLCWRE